MHYATTKAGIVALTKALASEFIGKGVRANSVAPGPIWSPLNPSGGASQEKVAHFGSGNSFGRPGRPVELAPIHVLLASPEVSCIIGDVYGLKSGAGIA